MAAAAALLVMPACCGGTTEPSSGVLTQTDVPVGPENLFVISDPNACFTQENGSATSNLTVNGVTLPSRDVPDGGGPGFGFRVSANGTVAP